jgi:DNA-binding transcriptional LysR family regulator
MQNWHLFKYALVVSRCGSYKLAARELKTSAVTVARKIEALEQSYRTPVFSTVDGRKQATPFGDKLIQTAVTLDGQITQFENENFRQDVFSGPFVINGLSFINNFFLSEYSYLFMERHPSVELILQASEAVVNLTQGHADISLRLSEPQEADLIRKPLVTIPVALYAPLESKPNKWVGLPHELDWLPEMKMARDYFQCAPSLRIDNYPGIAKAAKRNNFGCLLPSCISGYFSGLYALEPEGGRSVVASRKMWLAYLEKRKQEPVMTFASEWLGSIFQHPNKCMCGKCSII